MLQPLLSPREHEVLRQIAEGQTTQAISENLSIDPRTVECHRLSIRRKACILGGKTALFQFARRYFRKLNGGGGVSR